jgi:hypothetical protein
MGANLPSDRPDADSVDAAPRNDPGIRLAGCGGDVLEISVVMQHDRAVMLGNRGCAQIHDPGGPMMTPGRHTHPNVPGPFGDEPGNDSTDRLVISASAATRCEQSAPTSAARWPVVTSVHNGRMDGEHGRADRDAELMDGLPRTLHSALTPQGEIEHP